MKIELRQIDRTNYMECIELTVSEEQKMYVASNQFSLVQAAYEPNLYPLGIYSEDQMVGFILYDLDEELGGWSMSRFMIGTDFQNRGFGKQALKEFIAYFKAGHPEVKLLYTSAETDNSAAISLYTKAGFEQKEEFEYEFGGNRYREIRMILSL